MSVLEDIYENTIAKVIEYGSTDLFLYGCMTGVLVISANHLETPLPCALRYYSTRSTPA